MANAQNIQPAGPMTFPLFMKGVRARMDVLFAFSIIGIIVVLLLPVPTWLLDFLLAISLTISVMILMTVLFIDKPLDLSAFPTLLLISALLRLSLNIASTRLILANGHTGTNAAGHVIEAFGHFVMAGSVIIGLIVFGILTIINFVVITKGSGRIAEVSARFSLDAMPGKQMAIDADLSAGLINEDEARSRRKVLEDENTFYGAMDGASKFVRGDAIAGLLITFINLIGGMVIGMAQRDLSFSQAINTYSVLTIGDGLVAQIPALVVSLAAGLLVTKAGVSGSADKAVLGQLGKYPRAIMMSSVLIGSMALMPGIPALPFLVLGGMTGGVAWLANNLKKQPEQEKAEKEAADKAKAAAKPAEEAIADVLHIDALRLELGYGLLPLINYEKGHRLTEQIKALRKQLAREMGFVMAPVRIQDNMQLPAN
ncbi:MAG: FHIPEP family type III secretion protein, partial [Alphaproteobacteria bacterium]|nr:FHIPEP family type III secretion protein [Alphaproteobacteria bacterium]